MILFHLLIVFHLYGNSQLDSLKAIDLYNLAEESHEDPELYLKYANQSLPLLKSSKLWYRYFTTSFFVASTYFELEKHKKAELSANTCYTELHKYKVPDSTKIEVLSLLVVYYHSKANFDKALQLAIETLDIAKKSSDNTIGMGDIYTNIGFLSNRTGDSYKAIEYYELAKLNYLSDSTTTNYELANIYNNVGALYRQLGEFDEANTNYSKAIQIQEENTSGHTREWFYANILSGAASNQFKQGHYYESIVLLDKVLKIPKVRKDKYAYAHKLLGRSYMQLGQLRKARYFIELALKEHQDFFGDKHDKTASCYAARAEYEVKTNKIEEALFYYQLASSSLLINGDLQKDYTIIFDSIKTTLSDLDFIKYTTEKSKLLEKIKKPKLALANLEIVIEFIGKLRKSYQSSTSKLFLSEHALSIFEMAIELAFKLYQETGNEEYINKAFIYSEQYKAGVLLESLVNSEALGKSEIPDSLQQRKLGFINEIAFLNQQLSKKQSNDESSQKENLQYKIDLERELIGLEDKLEKNYPNYIALKNQNKKFSLADLREKLLIEKSLFIEYFYGQDNVYALFIDNKSLLDIKCLGSTDSLNNQINVFLSFFKQPSLIINQPKVYEKKANEIANRLKLDYYLDLNHYNHLVVVPDGSISSIPIGALVLTEQNTAQFSEMDFVLNTSTIQNAYSATLLGFQKEQKSNNRDNMLAIAPSFTKKQIVKLPENEQEVKSIDINNKEMLLGNDGSLDLFLEKASEFSILHLATHSSYSARYKQPIIEFADSSLLLTDLYAKQLSVDLVTISACESALGDLKKGEGVMSLARGFTFAGAKSLIASLWNVNDNSTSNLFKSFYDYLANGISKDKALNLAKQDLLNNELVSNAKKSPYYWAGFILIGNEESLAIERSIPPYKLILSLLLVFSLLGIGFWYRIRFN